MIPVPANVRIWVATDHTDMRRGMTGLALQVQEVLKHDPHAGDLYLFRGKRGDRATLCILPFRDLVAGVSCPLGLGRSCLGAG